MNSNSSEQSQNRQELKVELSCFNHDNNSPTTTNESASRSRSNSRDSSNNENNFNRLDVNVLVDRDIASNSENSMDNSRDSISSSGVDGGGSNNGCTTNQLQRQGLPSISNNHINLFNQQQEESKKRHHHQHQLQQEQQQQQHHHHHHHHQSLNQAQQPTEKDFEEVKQVELFGISIVALTINGKERLCLAQISNTLLKDFSYNEIHNRRVALGITCVQCTPIQLEMLRRAGAMPSSSRRCGMITRREAERLCRSFLVEEQPPELPENFHFSVAHKVNYGCKGRFIPARYISSRAKCIECFYCGEFYSPNKFIFHSHRQPHATDCNPPDSPNINSWRKHIDLDWTQEHSQDIKYAWEDVKSLFNGGTRRRAPNWQIGETNNLTTTVVDNSSTTKVDADVDKNDDRKNKCSLFKVPHVDDGDQLIDVECHDQANNQSIVSNHSHNLNLKNSTQSVAHITTNHNLTDNSLVKLNKKDDIKLNKSSNKLLNKFLNNSTPPSPTSSTTNQHRQYSQNRQQSQIQLPPGQVTNYNNIQSIGANRHHHLKRLNLSGSSSQHHHGNSKRQASSVNLRQQQDNYLSRNKNNISVLNDTGGNNIFQQMPNFSTFPTTFSSSHQKTQLPSPFCDFIATNSPPPLPPQAPIHQTPSSSSTLVILPQTQSTNTANQNNQTNFSLDTEKTLSQASVLNQMASSYPATNFIYSQLYSQLIQNQQRQQQPNQSANKQESVHYQQHSTQTAGSSLDAQLALRHHLWSSLIANLQCNAGNQIYNQQQQTETNSLDSSHCNSLLNSKDIVTDMSNSNFDLNHVRSDLPLKLQRHQIDNQTVPNSLEIYNPKTNVIQYSHNAKTFPSSLDPTNRNEDS